MPGPLPKATHSRERDTKRAMAGSFTVRADGETRGPDLASLTGRNDWPEAVLRWYETWRTSPMAATFLDTEWQRLGLVAYCVESFLNRPTKAMIEEIRMNEERLGATIADRLRMRMMVAAEPDAAPVLSIAKSASKDDIRKRAGGVSN